MSTDFVNFEPTPYPAGQHPLPREGALGRALIRSHQAAQEESELDMAGSRALNAVILALCWLNTECDYPKSASPEHSLKNLTLSQEKT